MVVAQLTARSGSGFESRHRPLVLNNCQLLTVCRKDKNKEEESGNGNLKSILRREKDDFVNM